MSWRSALKALSRTSPRTRCRVSTSSRTSSRPGMAGVAQDVEQALQEAHRAEMVELAADPGAAPGGGGDVRLAAQPGGSASAERRVAAGDGRAVGAQRLGERRRLPDDGRQPLLQQPVRGGCVHRGVIRARPGAGSAATASASRVNSHESSTGRNALGG